MRWRGDCQQVASVNKRVRAARSAVCTHFVVTRRQIARHVKTETHDALPVGGRSPNKKDGFGLGTVEKPSDKGAVATGTDINPHAHTGRRGIRAHSHRYRTAVTPVSIIGLKVVNQTRGLGTG